MKHAIVLGFILLAAIFSACSARNVESMPITVGENTENAADKIEKKQPVLVELYTSEGCSSCPPADNALAFLQKEQPYMQAEIITLALHVDYWNRLGWKDEFSSPLYSQRQTIYAQKLKLDSTYTPQMIVDGRLEFVGSDLAKASQAILEAAKSPKAEIETAFDGNNLKIKAFNIPKHEDATVYLAIAEDNLASNVKSGENSGKKLEHTSVVRELKSQSTLAAAQNSLELETALPLLPEWKRESLQVVVFLQENQSRRIFGVKRLALNAR